MEILRLCLEHPVLTGVLALIAAHVALHVFDRLVPPKKEDDKNKGTS